MRNVLDDTLIRGTERVLQESLETDIEVVCNLLERIDIRFALTFFPQCNSGLVDADVFRQPICGYSTFGHQFGDFLEHVYPPFCMAEVGGVEPPMRDSKPLALPLGYTPVSDVLIWNDIRLYLIFLL